MPSIKITVLAAGITAGLLVAAPNMGICQSQSVSVERATFETVAIHQDDPAASAGGFHTTRIRFYGDGLKVDHASVRTLIALAYGVDEDQIEGGPHWMGADSYDITATYGEQRLSEIRNLAPEEMKVLQRDLLISLLFDRFGLQIERTENTRPVYALVVSKGGTKLRPSTRGNTYRDGLKTFEGAPVGSGVVGYRFVGGAVDMTAQAGHIDELIQRLNTNARSLFLDRKIVDRTGIAGAYDFELTFSVPWIGHVPELGEIESLDGDTGSTLDDSLRQQLGLELHRSTAPVSVLIVKVLNHPSEN